MKTDIVMDKILDKINAKIPLRPLEEEFLKNPSDKTIRAKLENTEPKKTEEKDIPDFTIMVVRPIKRINIFGRSEYFEAGRGYTIELSSTENGGLKLSDKFTGLEITYKSIHNMLMYWDILEIVEIRTK